MDKKLLMGALIILILGIAGCKDKEEDKRPTSSDTIQQEERCDNLLKGIVAPLEDLQTFEDESYPEVTTTSRYEWDKERLPQKVLDLEGQGYICNPLPLDMQGEEVPGMHIQPAVTRVQWICELQYVNYQYIEKDNQESRASYEEMGYNCEKKECLDQEGQESFVWFCHK